MSKTIKVILLFILIAVIIFFAGWWLKPDPVAPVYNYYYGDTAKVKVIENPGDDHEKPPTIIVVNPSAPKVQTLQLDSLQKLIDRLYETVYYIDVRRDSGIEATIEDSIFNNRIKWRKFSYRDLSPMKVEPIRYEPQIRWQLKAGMTTIADEQTAKFIPHVGYSNSRQQEFSIGHALNGKLWLLDVSFPIVTKRVKKPP